MTFLQWAFVVGAGIAGYFGVSWLIDRGRAAKQDAPPPPSQDAPQLESSGTRQSPPNASAPAPAQAPDGQRSAWDEFNRP